MTEEQLKKETARQIRIRVTTYMAPWVLIGLIIIISSIRSCTNTIDPMDDSILARREVVTHLDVNDNTGNGFRVVYVTTNAVTTARLEEIRSRPVVKACFDSFQKEAPMYFGGSLVEVDIYDFAAFALLYDPDDIQMHNIFVQGKKKTALYAQPNPKIKNSATWINPNTEQGVQFINADDIYSRTRKEARAYRYWKCSGNYSMSRVDERFSHFSEDERLW